MREDAVRSVHLQAKTEFPCEIVGDANLFHLKRGFFLWKTLAQIGRIGSYARLMVLWGTLASGNIHRLGQTKDQATPSFEADHRAFRSLGWASPAPDEKA